MRRWRCGWVEEVVVVMLEFEEEGEEERWMEAWFDDVWLVVEV